MPKASLFGSLLEMQTEETARSVRDLDPATVQIPKTPGGKGPGQRFTLPEEVKKQLPGATVLEKSKREFEAQRSRVNHQTGDLRRREQEALYDRSKIDGVETSRDPGTARPAWFTEADLVGSKGINSVGLNVNQSYNRDKYGQKAPVHNYSLIGDVLRPGMDFPRRERTEIQMRNQGYGKGDMQGLLASPQSPRRSAAAGTASARSPRKKSLDLPPNIKHQFGSRVCDQLLSDQTVVEKTMQSQRDFKESVQRRSHPFNVPKFSREANPEYDMLGNSLRMNVVPGYTTDNKVSTTKTDYNDQVHLFRYQDPDKWRYQKDELSKWAEHNVLRQRMTKAWEQYFIETLAKKNPPT